MLNSVSGVSSIFGRMAPASAAPKGGAAFAAALFDATNTPSPPVAVAISDAAQAKAAQTNAATGNDPDLNYATIAAGYDSMVDQQRVDGASEEHIAMLEGSRDAFLGVVSKALVQGGFERPNEFVAGLSSDELQTLQKVGGLADPIRPSSLSQEGAFNLLLPRTMGRDLDHNAITNVGLANSIVFPPYDAPQEFKDAWSKATAGLDWATRTSMASDMWAMGPGQAVWSRGLSSETTRLTYQPFDYVALLDETIKNTATRVNQQESDHARDYVAAVLKGFQAVRANLNPS